MRHGGDLLLRAGGEGDGGALACQETGRRRPDAASSAGYERDVTGVYPTFGHSLLSAETYVLAAMDLAFVVSVFLMGGEFWEKVRRIFVYEGRI